VQTSYVAVRQEVAGRSIEILRVLPRSVLRILPLERSQILTASLFCRPRTLWTMSVIPALCFGVNTGSGDVVALTLRCLDYCDSFLDSSPAGHRGPLLQPCLLPSTYATFLPPTFSSPKTRPTEATWRGITTLA